MANRHQPYDLKQMQSVPLEGKILMTQDRIRRWYDHWNGQVYVSFSGGKDSTVLKHIVDGMYDDVPAVFVNTGLEYPEIQTFVREVKAGRYDCFNPDVEIIRPDMRFDDVIRKHGYPVVSKTVSKRIHERRNQIKIGKENTVAHLQLEGRHMTPDGRKSPYNYEKWRYLLDAPFLISDRCCYVMKKSPFRKYERECGRKPFVATMADESMQRQSVWIKYGCNAFEGKHPQSRPLSFWTEQDVLHYIKQYDVPYCPVYGDIRVKQSPEDTISGQINMIDYLGCYEPEDTLETTGCTRTGCMFCMFGAQCEREPNRFQRLKVTHPRQYAYCIGGGTMVDGLWQPSKEGLGLGYVLDYIGVPYGEVTGHAGKTDCRLPGVEGYHAGR